MSSCLQGRFHSLLQACSTGARARLDTHMLRKHPGTTSASLGLKFFTFKMQELGQPIPLAMYIFLSFGNCLCLAWYFYLSQASAFIFFFNGKICPFFSVNLRVDCKGSSHLLLYRVFWKMPIRGPCANVSWWCLDRLQAALVSMAWTTKAHVTFLVLEILASLRTMSCLVMGTSGGYREQWTLLSSSPRG